jgi:hypothetical protein
VLQGADVTLEPLDHNAVQASLRRCRAWGLFSAPPGHPADGLVRFTSGDPAFDRFFPVRYASPAVVDGLRSSHAAIAPLQWFLGRWGGKLLHLHVDQYALRCNLRRGGARKNSYLPADEMEPLLLDVAALARALDTQAAGQSA